MTEGTFSWREPGNREQLIERAKTSALKSREAVKVAHTATERAKLLIAECQNSRAARQAEPAGRPTLAVSLAKSTGETEPSALR